MAAGIFRKLRKSRAGKGEQHHCRQVEALRGPKLYSRFVANSCSVAMRETPKKREATRAWLGRENRESTRRLQIGLAGLPLWSKPPPAQPQVDNSIVFASSQGRKGLSVWGGLETAGTKNHVCGQLLVSAVCWACGPVALPPAAKQNPCCSRTSNFQENASGKWRLQRRVIASP